MQERACNVQAPQLRRCRQFVLVCRFTCCARLREAFVRSYGVELLDMVARHGLGWVTDSLHGAVRFERINRETSPDLSGQK